MNMKKIVTLLLAAALLVGACFAFASCNNTEKKDSEYVKSNGKLVIGVTLFEGMDEKDEQGNWIGFDAEMAQKFAASLGVQAEFKIIDWDNKLIDLKAKNIDCIWNGMTVTPAITAQCEVSGTYMLNGQVVVMKKGAFTDVAQLAGKQIAVESGSAGDLQAQEKLKSSNIKKVAAQVDALLEVKAGTSDACVIDYVLAKSLIGNPDNAYNNLEVLEAGELFAAEEYGVAFRKDSDLAAKADDMFAAAFADGSARRIAEKYGLEGSLVPAFKKNPANVK